MLLLDTCTLIWLVTDQKNLSLLAKQSIEQNKNNLFVSAVSALELGIKSSKKLISFSLPLLEWFNLSMTSHGLTELPIDSEIAVISTKLPKIHSDPADRLLIATAIKHHLTILSPDNHIHSYPKVKVIW